MHNKQIFIVKFACKTTNEKKKFPTKIIVKLKETPNHNPVTGIWWVLSFPLKGHSMLSNKLIQNFVTATEKDRNSILTCRFSCTSIKIKCSQITRETLEHSLCIRMCYRDDYHGGWPNSTAQSKAGQWFGLVNCKLTLTLGQFILVKCHEASLSSRT